MCRIGIKDQSVVSAGLLLEHESDYNYVGELMLPKLS